jgi:hypothetical protein
MHHTEVVNVEPEGQFLLVGQETRIHGGKLVHQHSEETWNEDDGVLIRKVDQALQCNNGD